MRLVQESLHVEDGTLCISSVEDLVLDEVEINEPDSYTTLKWFPDLERLLQSDHFRDKMLPTCEGLFVLSSVVKEYLSANWPTEFYRQDVVPCHSRMEAFQLGQISPKESSFHW